MRSGNAKRWNVQTHGVADPSCRRSLSTHRMHHSKLDEEPGRRGYSGELQGHYRTDRSRTRCPKAGGRGSCPGALSNDVGARLGNRSEQHTSELQSLMRTSYAVFCLKKKNINNKLKTRSTV